MNKKIYFAFVVSWLFSLTATYGQCTATYAPLPYTQSFESWVNLCDSLDAPDSSWINNPATGDNSWRRDDQGASGNWDASYPDQYTAPVGSYYARFNIYSQNGDQGTLDLHLNCSSSSGSNSLSFYYINQENGDEMVVYLSTDGINFNQIGTYAEVDNWAVQTISFSSVSPTTIIRFVATSDYGYYDIGLDSVSVSSLPLCAGTPAAGVASPSSVSLSALCDPSQTFTLSGGNYASIGGLTYQWQQSTDGINFTPVSGATNTTYTGSFAVTTYVNCLVTCTGSSLSTVSSTDTVNLVGQQSYIAVTSASPYTQGFENQWLSTCTIDNIPDNYWVVTPTSGDNSWRRDDDGGSAFWDGTLDNSAYIPTGSNANGASSFHSARFHSSWVDHTTGTFDLYLDLSAAGNKQISYDYLNTDGTDDVAVLISTTGPSGPFTLLDSVVASANWETRTAITSATSSTCVLRFRATGDYGTTDIGLDNVSIVIASACSGAPTAGVASPSNVSLFPCNPTQAFTLTGNYTGISGLSYQWQQSADGITFTPIPGATNTTYTSTFTDTMYINCLVTCANSNLSTPSNTDTVNFTPQAYVTVSAGNPYIQGFENQWISTCDIDNVPNTYWVNTPLTGSNSWRQYDNGATALWQDPNDYLYTPAGSDANGASSLSSATFHSSYANETTGTLDLYLDLSAAGTKQISYDYINTSGTDGLTVLISTTGPTGTFTSLDNVVLSANWQTRTVTTTATSNTCVLRFQATGDYGGTDIGLDNVSVFVATTCSGAPAAGVATPSNVSLTACNPTQTFLLSGNYAGIQGISYQWQQSTDNINYTPIPGATNLTYVGAFSTGTAYLNCLVTCANSNQSTASNTDTVNVTTAPSYVTVTQAVPYVQGFEDQWITKCGTGATGSTDDAPDNYWINFPATGNYSWRRDDDGASGGWVSPASGAYTPAGSDANGASSLYSARVHSFNATAGSTGILDLYLDLSAAGTKQVSYDYINTTGHDSLAVLISTNGPAGPFTHMDDVVLSANWATRTFNTNATGSTCVLRFQATSDFGGTDLGLDNVSVSVLSPCSGTPAAGVAGPSNAGIFPCNPALTFTLSGASNIGGLTYQWQQSTDGVNYTPVSGATNVTYTGSFTAATYVNCIVTCTASGLSATSNTDTANIVQGAEYVTVTVPNPYIQGFESPWLSNCATRNIPDDFWVNTPSTGDLSWRRYGDGASASWTSPFTYLYFPGGSNANGASSTHSAGFHSSFANSDSGTLDLYLNLSAPGTKQVSYDYINQNSSSNNNYVKVFISTTGPAGPFTQLDSAGQSFNWHTRTVTTDATSDTCVLRFSATGTGGNFDMGLDNIDVSVLTACSGAPVSGTSAPSSVTLSFCGATQAFSLSGYEFVTGITYQWQQSTDGINYAPILGATDTAYTGAFAAPTTYLNCLVTCIASGLSTASGTDTITIPGFPSQTITAGTALTFCMGDSVTFSSGATSGNTYQWLLNGNSISGANAATYTAGQAGVYTVALSNINSSCTDTSHADTVVVHPLPTAPVITETSGQLTTTTYSSYQWYLNGTAVSGATEQTYTPTINGIYYVVITDANGCSNQSVPYSLSDLGIASVASGIQSISLSPDPNTGEFIIKGTLGNTGGKRISFEVTNAIGQTVYKTDEAAGNGAWEKHIALGDNAANGLYLLYVNVDGQSEVIKFIVSR